MIGGLKKGLSILLKEFVSNLELIIGQSLLKNCLNDAQEKNFMYEILADIVNGVSKLVAKDTNSYLDRAKVSRELNDPLTKQQQIREYTLNRMGGNY